MRILHVATLVTPDAVFGGPVRVAENQAKALRSLGHDVVLFAGEQGWDGKVPTELAGTTAELYRARQLVPRSGTSGLFAPKMLFRLRSTLSTYDVVHVHLARDLVTLPVALMAERKGIPLILQTHGMVAPTDHPLGRPMDALLTKRLLLRADSVLHLTKHEKRDLLAVAPELTRLQLVPNGTPDVEDSPPLPAQAEVLFCARLHARKRPMVFVEAARQLLDEGLDASFVLVGPDDGEGPAVQAAVDAYGDLSKLRWEGPLAPELIPSRMAAASLYVLPALQEPFAMTVLEAMSVGRAAVVTRSCGMAEALLRHGGGVVIQETVDDLTVAVRKLVEDRALLQAMGERGREVSREFFGIGAVARQLVSLYDEARAAH